MCLSCSVCRLYNTNPIPYISKRFLIRELYGNHYLMKYSYARIIMVGGARVSTHMHVAMCVYMQKALKNLNVQRDIAV